MPLLGIAILPGNIHIVQLKKRNHSFTLLRACHEMMPLEIFNDGKIVRFDKLSECLKKVVQRERLAGMQAAVCLAAERVLIQLMRMPVGLSREEVAAEMAVEVQRHAQTRREPLTMDFHILPDPIHEQLEVMFAVTEAEYVGKYQACIESSGLRLAIMEVDAFALQRTLSSGLLQLGMMFFAEHTNFFAVMGADGGLVYRCWNKQEIELEAWLQQCALVCQQMQVTTLVMCAEAANVKQKIANAFAAVTIVDGLMDKQALFANTTSNSAAWLLAYGLAMRNPLPWLS